MRRSTKPGFVVANRGTVRTVAAAVPEMPVLVASGVTPATVAEILAAADGVIVATALTETGPAGPRIDPARLDALMQAAGRK